MKRITVWHIVDDTIRVDKLYSDGDPNAKIHPDGRGYVKTPGTERLYRRVEFISIDEYGDAQ